MSMSGFDGKLNNQRDSVFHRSFQERGIPSDFGEEDLVFAEELNALFSPEKEELPPYFVQTLLASDNPRLIPVEPGFEHKTSARVFRHLKLRRPLFQQPRSFLGAFITGVNGIFARRSLLASMAAFMLIMLFTVAFTAPSFAAGMSVLLQGARGGVYQVHSFPKVVHKRPKNGISAQYTYSRTRQLTLLAAQQQLNFQIYWPQSLPGHYVLDSIYLMHVSDEDWADGPIVELVYSLSGVAPKGTGQIVIREFMPSEMVLQLVQDNAVHPIQVSQDGRPKAIYVNGQWIPHGRLLPQWAYGERSELIFQQNGVVFWIAGDQYDGIGEQALWKTAQSLKAIPLKNQFIFMKSDAVYVTQAELSDVPDAFTNDVYVIYPDGSPDGAYFITESTYLSAKPVLKVVSHVH